jgi:ribosomal protein S18 acetylase RimI-like enzyme
MTETSSNDRIALIPMTADDYRAYRQITVSNYAADLVRCDGGTLDDASERAAGAFETLLPDGLASADQHLYLLHSPARKATIGYLWFGETHDASGPGAFIYDILVLSDFRGSGYGTQALHAVEDWALAHGIEQIGLAAFGHNEGAQRLYRRLGYETTQLRMRKRLQRGA